MIRAALLMILLGGAASAQAVCSEDVVSIRGDFGQARFKVSIADDPAERAQGLMNVQSMPMMEGMLFVYERPQSPQFWMRNTLIPLDMLFVTPDGTITRIHKQAIPLDETPIPGGDGVQMVLEVNGGMADRLGIAVGDQMQHPSFEEDAVWPCE
ncbi:MAG: hypothetical protein COB65_07310 [Thalassobium sp.]|nr:MAG: hypothetical protein COB65_07310 [Thalassobium sp.]|tara:strand:+ start:766 stop:1227 length:462 start_codon:yes stop_codon:yes gene_type:complete